MSDERRLQSSGGERYAATQPAGNGQSHAQGNGRDGHGNGRPPRERKGLLPLILIGLGLLFLVNNMGVMSWDIWGALSAVWPVILIAIGADVLTRGRYRTVIVLGALAVGVVLWLGGGRPGSAGGAPEQIAQSLEGASRAQIELAPGLARVNVGVGTRSGNLIEGNVSTGRDFDARQSFERRGDRAVYSLSSRRAVWLPFNWVGGEGGSRWDLRLSGAVPTEVRLNGGVGDVDMDLREARLSGLVIDGGVGDVFLTLPDGSYVADIDGGVGDVTVRLPRNVAARVDVDSGIGSVRVSGDFMASGDTWVSPGFESARNRVELRIDGGVGTINVQTY